MLPLMRAYAPIVSVRKLLALFVAVAVLLAPAFTHAGAALAAVPDHQMQMMEGGHCASPPAVAGSDHKSGGDHKSSGHDKAGCCISMCMAVAVSPPVAASVERIHSVSVTFALVNQYHGRITEIATPPPRLA